MELRGTLKVIEAALAAGLGRPEIVLPRGLSLVTIAMALHTPQTFAITSEKAPRTHRTAATSRGSAGYWRK
jgi:hypothetical protein